MEIRPILSALLRSKTGAILVALQVAISLAILANALHIVNVRQAVAARPSGIANESEIVHIRVRHLVKSDHNAQLALFQSEAAALRAVPGVTSVAFANQAPLSQSGSTTGVAADPKQTRTSADVSLYTSGDSLVKTWGLNLVEGRDYRRDEVVDVDNDARGDQFPRDALITRALAARLWPGASSVVGKTFYRGLGSDAPAMQVLGVVERLQTVEGELGDDGEMSMIVPLQLTNGYGTMYAIRAEPGQLLVQQRQASLLWCLGLEMTC